MPVSVYDYSIVRFAAIPHPHPLFSLELFHRPPPLRLGGRGYFEPPGRRDPFPALRGVLDTPGVQRGRLLGPNHPISAENVLRYLRRTGYTRRRGAESRGIGRLRPHTSATAVCPPFRRGIVRTRKRRVMLSRWLFRMGLAWC